MSNEKYGLRILNEDGSALLNLGAHVIKDKTKFAEKIGIIAASWSQAENNILCLLSLICNISLDEAEKTAKKFNSAEKMIKELRIKAKSVLSGDELNSLIEALNELDAVRSQRNRVQHDVWAVKGIDDSRLYYVHIKEYLAFNIEILKANDLFAKGEIAIDQVIDIANNFADKIVNSFTVEDLIDISEKIDNASKSIMTAMFTFLINKKIKN